MGGEPSNIKNTCAHVLCIFIFDTTMERNHVRACQTKISHPQKMKVRYMMDYIKQYYDDLAFQYDKLRFENSYGQYVDTLERSVLSSLLENSDPKDNLEIACGTGRLLDFASTGVDSSENMLRMARAKYPYANLIKASFEETPFRDNSFSNIYAFHLLMHLNESKVQDFSNEAMRLLKDDGRLIVDVPSHFRRRFQRKRKHWHGSYSPHITLFECWGWKITKVHPIMFVPIHRVQKEFRKSFIPLERVLSSLLPTACASYTILEMRNLR